MPQRHASLFEGGTAEGASRVSGRDPYTTKAEYPTAHAAIFDIFLVVAGMELQSRSVPALLQRKGK